MDAVLKILIVHIDVAGEEKNKIKYAINKVCEVLL